MQLSNEGILVILFVGSAIGAIVLLLVVRLVRTGGRF
jgi:uncharacterized membrane protein YeaQ/YmgE (transglycosylase-associated protein family)